MGQFEKLFLFPLLPSLRLVFFIFAAPPFICALLVIFSVENTAIIDTSWSLNSRDIQRAKTIVSNTASQEQKEIKLSEKDLNIALSYLLNYYIHSTSEIEFTDKQLNFKISLLLNKNIFGKYLNFSFALTKHHGYPMINSLKIGQLKIADEFAGQLIESIIKYTPLKEYYILAAQHVRDIQIKPQSLNISYITSADLTLKNKLSLSNKNFQSVIFYQQQITNIIARHDPKWRLSLASLLQPLFRQALQRSTPSTAVSENRALLIAISTYVNKSEIQAFLPFDITPSGQQQHVVSIYRRKDMAQHFVISAALAASGAETLAYMIGQEKEITDSKRGSGFSFVDLACDRAGLFFGKTAVASTISARTLQKRMAKIKDYTAFMPEVRDLPENMNKRVFEQRFKSVYSSEYQYMLQKIDSRISNLALYQ